MVVQASTKAPWAPERETLPLDNPFKQRLVLQPNLSASKDHLARVLPLRELASATPSDPWWHYGVHTWLGPLLIDGSLLPPARLRTREQRGLTVLLGYGGEQQVQQDSSQWRCGADGCLLLSGEAFSWESSLVSLLAFQLDSDRLLDTAMAMAGLRDRPDHWQETIDHPHSWNSCSTGIEVGLMDLLRQEMALANRLIDHQALVDALQLDDRIYRLMAAAVLEEVRQGSALDRLSQRNRQGRDVFDELIDFILLNLAHPLNLTMLEEQSHYSRRALQYAFQERMGCSATQWIRSQRLDRARQQLQNPNPGDSVASIATENGYRSLSLFSVDFQHRFHVKPSRLLREARCSRVSPPG